MKKECETLAARAIASENEKTRLDETATCMCGYFVGLYDKTCSHCGADPANDMSVQYKHAYVVESNLYWDAYLALVDEYIKWIKERSLLNKEHAARIETLMKEKAVLSEMVDSLRHKLSSLEK
ncbi:MAG TPA: hypothetical protein VJ044_05860 [Candidatus Hodarchaeales archaeon]|nr:hypothetical protein [Candidatus Hodarchaeales archaeon]